MLDLIDVPFVFFRSVTRVVWQQIYYFLFNLKVTEIGFRVEIFSPYLTLRLWRYA
jgi:hypothetical protein